jgi:DNA-directed RNA polymerase subunit RPC12/RpoP
MKALFTICDGWKRCENKDLRELFERKMREGKNFKWPSERQIEELDKICSSCKHSLELKEEKCPVCGGTIFGTPAFPMPSEIKAVSATQYFYKCMNCERHLYSFIKIS